MYGGPCGEYMYEGLARSPGPVCGVRSGTGGRGGVWVGTDSRAQGRRTSRHGKGPTAQSPTREDEGLTKPHAPAGRAVKRQTGHPTPRHQQKKARRGEGAESGSGGGGGPAAGGEGRGGGEEMAAIGSSNVGFQVRAAPHLPRGRYFLGSPPLLDRV